MLRSILLLIVLGLLSACNSEHPLPQQKGTVISEVTIEQMGGFVGAGSPGGHVRMRGRVAWSALSEADRAAIDRLFTAKTSVNANLYYRLTRQRDGRTETVDALPEQVPRALADSVQTTLE